MRKDVIGLKTLRPDVAYPLLFFGVLALSTSGIFAVIADAPPSITAGYRLLFAALFISPALFMYRSRLVELKHLSTKDWWLILLSGLFLAGHYTLWFESLRFTSVASSVVLVTLQPLFAFIGGYFFFHERLTRQMAIGGLMAIAGSALIGWHDFQVNGWALFGDLLALLAAGIITGYFLVGQKMRKHLSLIPYTLIGYGSSAVFLFAFSFGTRVPVFHYPLRDWLCFLGLALISTIMGQMIFNYLLKWMNAATISMSILGEPVGTCLLAYFLLHQGVSMQQFIGILIILAGIAIFLFRPAPKRQAPHQKNII
ncbi:MAG: DMT family transporter [Sporolactobacillus sp.]